MKKVNIAAIVGSLRAASWNRQLAQKVAEVYGADVQFEILDYSDLPYMNEDIEFPAPASVQRLRERIEKADGVWFFTPEYNHSYSGVMKNFLDWMSRPDELQRRVLAGKPATISGISLGMSGTLLAQEQLYMLLSVLGMDVMKGARLSIPNARTQTKDGVLVLKESEVFLEQQCQDFLQFLQK